MAHQIKILMANKTIEPLTGLIEGDECFIGGLNKNRHADKKVPESQGKSKTKPCYRCYEKRRRYYCKSC